MIYNFHMIISRQMEATIASDLKYFPVVAILGPRQSGKTTLAKAIIADRRDTLYLDLERPSDLAKLQDAETFLSMHQDKLICIDEVQLRPELFPLLRALVDERRSPGRFLVLGSSSPELLRQSSETLAGRLSYIYVTPFTLPELLDSEIQNCNQNPDTYQFLWRGGFPDSYLAANDEQSFRWRENYIQTFIERDLRQFGIDLNPQRMRRLWLMCAHMHGQVMNYSKLGQSMDMTHPTIKRHIDILEATFMMRRLPPFAVNTKKRLVKSPKLYIRDSGILTSMLELVSFDRLYSHPIYGACWEGFVIETLLAILQPKGLYGFFRTHGGDEIDLIVEHRGKRLGFECKTSSSSKPNKRNFAAAETAGLDKLFTIVPKGTSYPIDGDNAWIVPLVEISSHFNQ